MKVKIELDTNTKLNKKKLGKILIILVILVGFILVFLWVSPPLTEEEKEFYDGFLSGCSYKNNTDFCQHKAQNHIVNHRFTGKW